MFYYNFQIFYHILFLLIHFAMHFTNSCLMILSLTISHQGIPVGTQPFNNGSGPALATEKKKKMPHSGPCLLLFPTLIFGGGLIYNILHVCLFASS